MNRIGYLRILSESVDDDVIELLNTSSLESDALILKGSTILAAEITAAKAEKDPEEKKKKWKKALRDAKALRKRANEIPPDGLKSHTWRMLTQPWWETVMDYGKVLLKREKIKDMSKDEAIQKFDKMIAYIERQLKKLEK